MITRHRCRTPPPAPRPMAPPPAPKRARGPPTRVPTPVPETEDARTPFVKQVDLLDLALKHPDRVFGAVLRAIEGPVFEQYGPAGLHIDNDFVNWVDEIAAGLIRDFPMHVYYNDEDAVLKAKRNDIFHRYVAEYPAYQRKVCLAVAAWGPIYRDTYMCLRGWIDDSVMCEARVLVV